MVEIGVDIGGTFTDVVCRHANGTLNVMKVPTSRADPSLAVLAAVAQLRDEWAVAPQDIARFVHGTTVATNAVLERRGPKTGLITTSGFRDILEIGRQVRSTVYKVLLQPEEPVFLSPGALRMEVPERISAQGEVVTPLDEAAVLAAADELVEKGVRGIAICFLFSFLDSRHEERAAELIRQRYPDLHLSLSSQVDPAFREYERTVVTALDAYIKPVVDDYLTHLRDGLKVGGVEAPLRIMQSRGGIAMSHVAQQTPVRLFLSGPAAGVIGAQNTGSMDGISDLISVDIGGTSSDISLIRQGRPLVRPEGLVAGYQVRVPMVDVNAIGAGGGSLAWLDGAGGLRVGPHSAGSEPGPACYGRGGTQPTVSDASVVLGYIDPAYFAGGRFSLNPALAHAAIEEKIALPLGISTREAALGIHRVVSAQMAEGIRLVSIRQGFDPREFTLLPLGGNGGIHACALAAELSIGRVLLARHPGVLSAIGLLSAQTEHAVSTAYGAPLDKLSVDDLGTVVSELDARCMELMRQEQLGAAETDVSYYADICYMGQSHYLEVPFALDGAVADALYRDFRSEHERVLGHSTDSPARIVNLRVIRRSLPEKDVAPPARQPGNAAKAARREISLIGYPDPQMADVYNRDHLEPGQKLHGPAIIEQSDSTTVVYPDWSIDVLESGNILLTRD
ncbi:hydantoinase/oxoprolinase family protein [Aureimonas fodinaquatilis]|uniref:Hydantoinase/oxoprolinase family protein n=1 Tax=Aureimonas fodinaquatilis TaxID=2565783 RepID=A0A5B0DPY8_9HYPH|nr:hydantoinase/oxoprolinase family protein [Aureimonas fodinaquatilis]KAA0968907.1 hydantoinase/oxoprolinase family protein [Aureimonas fodinaquatilis]